MQVTNPIRGSASMQTFAAEQKLIQAIRESEHPELFVINNSDLPDHHNRPTDQQGTILMRCSQKGINGDHRIRIPSSFVPIQLTTQSPCTKDDLLASADLARLRQTKRIKLISYEDAMDIIDKDGESRAEYDRVMAIAMRIGDYTGADTQGNIGEPTEISQINGHLETVVDGYKSGAMSLPRLRAEVRRMERTLNLEDMAYLNREVPDWNN
jgi:hypothetical protein